MLRIVGCHDLKASIASAFEALATAGFFFSWLLEMGVDWRGEGEEDEGGESSEITKSTFRMSALAPMGYVTTILGS